MTRLRRLGLLGALLVAGWSPAVAEPVPTLEEHNLFSAVGSAEGTFTLTEEAVLESSTRPKSEVRHLFSDDARIRTEGRWAALIVQQLQAPKAVFSFASLPGQCGALAPTCEPYESDRAVRAESLLMSDPDEDGVFRYLLPPGAYVVAILGEEHSRTTAALSLTAASTEDLEHVQSHVAREAAAVVAPPVRLTRTTQGTIIGSRYSDVLSAGTRGELEAGLPGEGVVVAGFAWDYESAESGARIEVDTCLEVEGGARWACLDGWSVTSCLCPVIGSGAKRSHWGWSISSGGPVTWRWEMRADTRVITTAAWLISWAYVSD